ncbi:MAG: hypothetical protein IPI33_15280 [Dehalococcoidia bacterium]|nr:hypothetical protein [Dehalococcoidia bacterium]
MDTRASRLGTPFGRRRMITASASAGIGLAGLAIAGCGDDDDEDSGNNDSPDTNSTPAVKTPKRGGT